MYRSPIMLSSQHATTTTSTSTTTRQQQHLDTKKNDTISFHYHHSNRNNDDRLLLVQKQQQQGNEKEEEQNRILLLLDQEPYQPFRPEQQKQQQQQQQPLIKLLVQGISLKSSIHNNNSTSSNPKRITIDRYDKCSNSSIQQQQQSLPLPLSTIITTTNTSVLIIASRRRKRWNKIRTDSDYSTCHTATTNILYEHQHKQQHQQQQRRRTTTITSRRLSHLLLFSNSTSSRVVLFLLYLLHTLLLHQDFTTTIESYSVTPTIHSRRHHLPITKLQLSLSQQQKQKQQPFFYLNTCCCCCSRRKRKFFSLVPNYDVFTLSASSSSSSIEGDCNCIVEENSFLYPSTSTLSLNLLNSVATSTSSSTPTIIETDSPSLSSATTHSIENATRNHRSIISSSSSLENSLQQQSSSSSSSSSTTTTTTTTTGGTSSGGAASSSSSSSSPFAGLSKFHLSILRRNIDRQRFVTGRYPVLVQTFRNPTRKWLNVGRRGSSSRLPLLPPPQLLSLPQQQQQQGILPQNKNNGGRGGKKSVYSTASETELYVNGTTPDRSSASIDRYHWLDDHERQVLQNIYEMVVVELVAEIHLERPGYLQILSANTAGSTTEELYRRHSHSSHTQSTKQLLDGGGDEPIFWRRNKEKLQRLIPKFQYYNTNHNDNNLHEGREKNKKLGNLDSSRMEQQSIFPKSLESYPPLIEKERLWVTGFSLASRKGIVTSVDTSSCQIHSINDRTAQSMLWPNEVQSVPTTLITSTTPMTKTKTKTNSPPQPVLLSHTTAPVLLHSLFTNNNNHGHVGNDTHISLTSSCVHNSIPNIPITVSSHHDRTTTTTTISNIGVEQTVVSMENENTTNPHRDALLVCDGFLVPTKDRGGLYIVHHPGNPVSEFAVRLTDVRERWFYHRAVWIDLTGDGRQSILSARCQVSTGLGGGGGGGYTSTTTTFGRNKNNKNRTNSDGGFITSGIRKLGQLVWLECPKPSRYDPLTGTPLERDGTVFDPFATHHLPWRTHILSTGPDVMFAVADLDQTDTTIEVLSSNFFEKKVQLYSIQTGPDPHVSFSRTIDDECGQAFSCVLADLDRGNNNKNILNQDTTQEPIENLRLVESRNMFQPDQRTVIDSGSTVKTLTNGDTFSHLLVTSHECSYKAESTATPGGSTNSETYSVVDTTPAKILSDTTVNSSGGTSGKSSSSSSSGGGGSLYAYRVPNRTRDAWRTDEWVRSTIASGFKVNGQLNNMINPGAPGFVYTFYSQYNLEKNQYKRPLIAVAGDCSEAAYIYRPAHELDENNNNINNNNMIHDDADIDNTISSSTCTDRSCTYKLMIEIDCEATVGSIGIGYDDFATGTTTSTNAQQQQPTHQGDSLEPSPYAKLYIPCYEKDKVLVFGLGSGEDDEEEVEEDQYDSGW